MASGRKWYLNNLKDPRWQRVRLEVFQRDGWRCTRCGSGEKTLHVHHKRYLPGRWPWEYPTDLLATLCEVCHGDEHGKASRAAVTPLTVASHGWRSQVTPEEASRLDELREILAKPPIGGTTMLDAEAEAALRECAAIHQRRATRKPTLQNRLRKGGP